MKLTVFKYGESVYNECYLFEGGDPDRLLPISFVFYLIETGARRLLVDVGCNDGAGFVMRRFCRPVEALREAGVLPDDVTDILLTHAHHDHIEAVGDFPKAAVYLHEDAYRDGGAAYLAGRTGVHRFTSDFTPCRGVTVRHIGGHAPGSCVVLLQSGDKTQLLCGDECYLADNFARGIPTGASIDPARSRAFLRDYTRPDVTPRLFHDPAILPDRLGWEVLLCDGN